MYLKRMEDTQWFRKSAVYVSGRKGENQFKQESGRDGDREGDPSHLWALSKLKQYCVVGLAGPRFFPLEVRR